MVTTKIIARLVFRKSNGKRADRIMTGRIIFKSDAKVTNREKNKQARDMRKAILIS
ncbi:MAG: hypothetical protein UT77_C0003G0047 [Candidatus Daviesbacteria bacterium GW2011_GWC2_40_12]|uniref:Uncharacterized protein n=1 Tax=Candidatus Daviesbacteria bacterium GW2011_GWC2_40_12 TaxID=1618431 RepID=A0A0G0TWB4_9BACT|nr:MAG: hypothetical protein UT04_C0060G0006 [Candidatus Daviesbacteria bacterium GW2011_GWF2_38_7]KKR16375.1 MAG: hypothetical protein UT45_C0006G0050 [Candidatus Daviesbacteria bacterium GW2011_GWA2_39_33]KKR42252.1 MAG: hypothetical protein UT77_C0003G0047 [Candidatus Daviesbacteria bacterium GW2011_GWC2_40_12]